MIFGVGVEGLEYSFPSLYELQSDTRIYRYDRELAVDVLRNGSIVTVKTFTSTGVIGLLPAAFYPYAYFTRPCGTWDLGSGVSRGTCTFFLCVRT